MSNDAEGFDVNQHVNWKYGSHCDDPRCHVCEGREFFLQAIEKTLMNNGMSQKAAEFGVKMFDDLLTGAIEAMEDGTMNEIQFGMSQPDKSNQVN